MWVPDSIDGRIPACHAGGLGSIPSREVSFFAFFLQIFFALENSLFLVSCFLVYGELFSESHCRVRMTASAASVRRLSGLQKEVLSLYKSFLREALRKDPQNQGIWVCASSTVLNRFIFQSEFWVICAGVSTLLWFRRGHYPQNSVKIPSSPGLALKRRRNNWELDKARYSLRVHWQFLVFVALYDHFPTLWQYSCSHSLHCSQGRGNSKLSRTRVWKVRYSRFIWSVFVRISFPGKDINVYVIIRGCVGVPWTEFIFLMVEITLLWQVIRRSSFVENKPHR